MKKFECIVFISDDHIRDVKRIHASIRVAGFTGSNWIKWKIEKLEQITAEVIADKPGIVALMSRVAEDTCWTELNMIVKEGQVTLPVYDYDDDGIYRLLGPETFEIFVFASEIPRGVDL